MNFSLLPGSLVLQVGAAPGAAPPVPVAPPPAPSPETATASGTDAIYVPAQMRGYIESIVGSQDSLNASQKSQLRDLLIKLQAGEVIIARYGANGGSLGVPLMTYTDEAGQHLLMAGDDPLSKLIDPEYKSLMAANLEARIRWYYAEHSLGQETDFEKIKEAVLSSLAKGNENLLATLRDKIRLVAEGKLSYFYSNSASMLGCFERVELTGLGTAYEYRDYLPADCDFTPALLAFVQISLENAGVDLPSEQTFDQLLTAYKDRIDWNYMPVNLLEAESQYVELGLLQRDTSTHHSFGQYYFSAQSLLDLLRREVIRPQDFRGRDASHAPVIYVRDLSALQSDPATAALLLQLQLNYGIKIEERPAYFNDPDHPEYSDQLYVELWSDITNPKDYNMTQCAYYFNAFQNPEWRTTGHRMGVMFLMDYMLLKYKPGMMGEVRSNQGFQNLVQELMGGGVGNVDLDTIIAEQTDLEQRFGLVDTAPLNAFALLDDSESNDVEMVIDYTLVETPGQGLTPALSGITFENAGGHEVEGDEAVVLEWLRDQLIALGISPDFLGEGEEIPQSYLTYLVSLYRNMEAGSGSGSIMGSAGYLDDLMYSTALPLEHYVPGLGEEGVDASRIITLFLQGGLLLEGYFQGEPDFLDEAEINQKKELLEKVFALLNTGLMSQLISKYFEIVALNDNEEYIQLGKTLEEFIELQEKVVKYDMRLRIGQLSAEDQILVQVLLGEENLSEEDEQELKRLLGNNAGILSDGARRELLGLMEAGVLALTEAERQDFHTLAVRYDAVSQSYQNDFDRYNELRDQIKQKTKEMMDILGQVATFSGTEEEIGRQSEELLISILNMISMLLPGGGNLSLAEKLKAVTDQDLAGLVDDVRVILDIYNLPVGHEELLARMIRSSYREQEVRINAAFVRYLLEQEVRGMRAQSVLDLIDQSRVTLAARLAGGFAGLPVNLQFMMLLEYFKLVDATLEGESQQTAGQRYERLKAFLTRGETCAELAGDLVQFFKVLNQNYDVIKMASARAVINGLNPRTFVILESSLRQVQL